MELDNKYKKFFLSLTETNEEYDKLLQIIKYLISDDRDKRIIRIVKSESADKLLNMIKYLENYTLTLDYMLEYNIIFNKICIINNVDDNFLLNNKSQLKTISGGDTHYVKSAGPCSCDFINFKTKIILVTINDNPIYIFPAGRITDINLKSSDLNVYDILNNKKELKHFIMNS